MKLFILSYLLISFTAYLIYIISKYGVLKSISDSYYFLEKKGLFFVFIINTSWSFMIVGETWLMFLAGALLMFVGGAAAFKEKTTGIVHVIGAIGGITAGMASLCVDFKLWWLVILYTLLALFLSLANVRNRTWWIEVSAFVTVIIGLLIAVA